MHKHDAKLSNKNIDQQIKYYTIIDFNEVDIRIYLPEKSDNSSRPLGRGEYHF